MMGKLWVVCRFTFLEGLRGRFFAGTFVMSLFLLFLGSLLASLPYGKTDEVMARIGWGAVFLLGFLLSTFYAVQHLTRERDQRVLHLLLAKPISRVGYALGKFLGLWMLTSSGIFAQGLALLASLYLFGQEPHTLKEWLLPSLVISLKCGVLLSVALLASVLFGSFLSLLITVTVYLAGVGSEDLFRLVTKKEPALKILVYPLIYGVPQFSWVDVEGWVIFKKSYLLSTYFYVFTYLGGYLLLFLLFYLVAFTLMELKD